MFKIRVINGRDGIPLWKERCHLKLPPKLRYDVAVSLLWKDGRSGLMEPVLMAFGAHNLAFEVLSVQSRMSPALEEEEVPQCRSEAHAFSVGICHMSAAEQLMAADSKSLQKSESTPKNDLNAQGSRLRVHLCIECSKVVNHMA